MGGSAWRHVPMPPLDPIMASIMAWQADPQAKLNLGVGAYRTEEGKPLVLNVVRKAEAALAADPSINKEYSAITGDPLFNRLARELAFGASHPALQEGRVVTVQTLSGTGALRVGAEFLAGHYPVKKVLVPAPTWPTHWPVFTRAGLQVSEYRYFDHTTKGLDIEGLLADLSAAESGSVVVLHACTHNPTGVDPTQNEWRSILKVVQQRGLMPFFDSAYQGFASGDLDADAFAIRLFAGATRGDEPLEMMLAQSFAKNMGLYGERIGALSIVASQAAVLPCVEGQLRMVIRPMYLTPPRHGAEIAAHILGSPELLAEWRVELKGMAQRIQGIRKALLAALKRRNVPGDWSFVTKQIGMFTYTGLTPAQCEFLTTQRHLHLTSDGRISMAGLNTAGVEVLADGIADAMAALPTTPLPVRAPLEEEEVVSAPVPDRQGGWKRYVAECSSPAGSGMESARVSPIA